MLTWTIGVVDAVRAVLGGAVSDGDAVRRSSNLHGGEAVLDGEAALRGSGLCGTVLAVAARDDSVLFGDAVHKDGSVPGGAGLEGAGDATQPVCLGGLPMVLEPGAGLTSISTRTRFVLLVHLQESVSGGNWKGKGK